MNITRYPQSCLAIEKGGHKIVIDPGDPFLASHTARELKDAAAIFYTHDHFDHCNRDLAAQLSDWGIPLFGNESVVALLQDTPCTTVTPGKTIAVAGFRVTPQFMAHSDMVDGKPGPQNTGYVIDNHLLHPGDSPHTEGIHVPVIALPLIGPDISPRRACEMARTMEAKTAIAIHYDLWGAKADFYKSVFERFTMPFDLKIVADGGSIEV